MHVNSRARPCAFTDPSRAARCQNTRQRSFIKLISTRSANTTEHSPSPLAVLRLMVWQEQRLKWTRMSPYCVQDLLVWTTGRKDFTIEKISPLVVPTGFVVAKQKLVAAAEVLPLVVGRKPRGYKSELQDHDEQITWGEPYCHWAAQLKCVSC